MKGFQSMTGMYVKWKDPILTQSFGVTGNFYLEMKEKYKTSDAF